MKSDRHEKIIELIENNDIETQEELCRLLREAGFDVTQATVSRDINRLKLIKVSNGNGRQKYAVIRHEAINVDKYKLILRESFVSVDNAQNLLIVKTVPGMAMPVAAAIDHMKLTGLVGCIAGDDTVMCAMKSTELAVAAVKDIQSMV